ncbi:hypothetical protein BgiBS90_018359, partial [Biomphalaria glabrata]
MTLSVAHRRKPHALIKTMLIPQPFVSTLQHSMSGIHHAPSMLIVHSPLHAPHMPLFPIDLNIGQERKKK